MELLLRSYGIRRDAVEIKQDVRLKSTWKGLDAVRAQRTFVTNVLNN